MSNVSVVQAVLHAVESADWATLDSLLADDFTFSGPVPQPLNKTRFLELSRALQTALPDWKFNGTNWREEGDHVFGRLHVSGTQTGTLAVIPQVPPVPPTGKQVQLVEEPAKITVRNGKVVSFEVDPVPNGGVYGIYAQVGAPLPAPQS